MVIVVIVVLVNGAAGSRGDGCCRSWGDCGGSEMGRGYGCGCGSH